MSAESSEAVKSIADGVAVAGTVGVVIKILPVIASVFTILWLGVRLWESETVKKLTGRD
tara:strand:- start:129 stop:305 length:177 start_codon:yes stop_codon:yes gene_type:complete